MKMKKLSLLLLLAVLFSAVCAPVVYAGGSDDMVESPSENDPPSFCPPPNIPGTGTSLTYPDTATVATVLPFADESDAKSLILIEATTGKVLYEKDADLSLPPASVTKVMTMLLVMEAIDSGLLTLTDEITVSENAASMGGSQVFLEPGETMTVDELLKCVVVVSANDACVALAEHIAGSEEAFVMRMNERAKELGMTHTNFENTNGLDDTALNHYTSARDIAIMSAELITKHPAILGYSSIWMDSIRGGAFGLTNTNRLVRFYNGCNGLKTGSTSKAGFCVSASAKRGDTQLIAVVMGASTRDSRNEVAKKLFDHGFASYVCEHFEPQDLAPVKVVGGTVGNVGAVCEGFDVLLPKASAGKVEVTVTVPETLNAPVRAGEVIGTVTYTLNGETIAEKPIITVSGCDRIGFWEVVRKLILRVAY